MIAPMDAALRRQFLTLLDADLRLASAGVPEEEFHGQEGWGAVRMIWAHERQRRTLEAVMGQPGTGGGLEGCLISHSCDCVCHVQIGRPPVSPVGRTTCEHCRLLA